MSDPDRPQPLFTGAGHKAFVGEPASDPFEFLQESSSTHEPESELSFPPSGPQMQPSLAFESGGRGRGGISQLTQAPLARLASQAESDGVPRSPGILPSPTSAFSPYQVDNRHALPSLLQDPSEIMLSNVTILTPSPVPPSPDKKEAPPKTGTPAQPVPSNDHMPTAPLMGHHDSVTAGSELQQPVSSAPTGTPLGEVPHTPPGMEVPHPLPGVEVPHLQRQVEESQQQVEALPAQHQMQMPRPQQQAEVLHSHFRVELPHPQPRVELPHPQPRVELPHPQPRVELPRPQHQVEVPHTQHQVEVPYSQHQVEVPHPQHQVEVPRPQHQVEVPHPQHQVGVPYSQHQVEVPYPQHQVEVQRPQHQVEVPHSQHQVEVPHSQHQVEVPHPQHQVEVPRPQHQVEVPHPQHQVEVPHPQHQVEVPRPQQQVGVPQHRGTIPNILHQEAPSGHLQHLTSHGTLAPSGAKGTALSPNPPTRLPPAMAPPPDTSSSRPVEPRGLIAFSDHPSDHQLAARLPTEGLQSSERAPTGVVYEMGISRQASEGFPLEPTALQPSQPRPSGSHALHSSTNLGTPVERSSEGHRPDRGMEGFGELTPLSDVHSSRDGAHHSVRPVPYDGLSHDHSDRHSYYEGERGRPPLHEEWSRYNRPRYSSRHYHERDRGHYYGNHGYQQDHHGNHHHHHYARHHYDYDPSYHYHYGDWEYAWQQQQDRNQHYDSRYIDPRQRGYPYDYWRGRDRRQDPQYSGHDSSSLYDASQSWVDPASISHISDYGHSGYDTMSYTDGHTRDDYLYDHRYEGWEGDNPGNYPTEEWIQNTAGYPASEPARETPLLFAQPHAPARFGVGGVLLVVTPTIPSQYTSATVEVHALQELVPEYSQFAASVESSPAPLVPGETPKSSVVSFVAEEAARSRETSEKAEDEESREGWRERALLWEYLLLLCRQNGVVVPSDLSELLTKDAGIHAASFDLALPSNDAPPSEKLHQFRMLILSGRKKDALDHACRQGLWGHALMVAMTMEEQSRQYVVNRFTASLLSSDPLNTFYTLMLGRMPTVSKPEGLTRGGDWRPHLSVMLSNRNTSDSKAAIVSLGDSLRSRGRLFAAHFCYKVAEVEFAGYGDRSCRYALLGVDPRTLDVGQYPSLNQLAMTEVYEYAMTLGLKDFSLPKFQLLKFLHIWKLVEAGLPVKALGYCEVTANSCLKCPELINPSALYQLAELSVRLHFHVHGGGVVHSELPQWIIQLCRVIPFQDSKQEGHTLPKASPAPPPQSNSARDSPVTSSHFGDSTGHAPKAAYVGDGEEYPPEDLLMPGSSSQVSVHSSVSQQQQQQEDHAHTGWGHQEDPQSAAVPHPPQGPATLSQPPAPEGTGYSQMPSGYGVQQSHEPATSQSTAAVGGLYQDHYGYGQQEYSHQGGAQRGFGVPPTPSHTDAPQAPMSGALPPQGYTAAPQGHMTGAPPSQGHAYAPPGPNAAGGYAAMLTPVNPQPFAEPSLPPSNQDRQQADLGKQKDEDEDPGKGEDSSKTSSGVMHFFRNLFPKKGGVHLPDDKPESKKIVWDPEKKKWINKEAGEESTAAPPPPPTDMQLQSMQQQQQPFVMMPLGGGMSGPGALNQGGGMSGPGALTQGGGMSGPGALNQAAPGSTAPQLGRYGLKSRRTQAKYVDVFGGSKTSSQTAPPPPVMPLGGGTYSGNFFVPTAAGSADGLGESMAYFSGSEQPFPTENTAAQPS